MLRRPLVRRLAYLRRNRCGALLAALCFFILADPFLAGSAIGAIFLTLSLLAILVLAVWALRVRRQMFWMVLVLAVLAGEALVVHRLGEHWLRPVALAATAIFIGVVTVALLRYVLDSRAITADKIFGAVAAYMLIAFTFATLFVLLEFVQPAAFNLNVATGPDGRAAWSDLMYFSFTVLTSTGFGEITPATRLARNLIVIEQVLGVMYVAFLIARLANMYPAPRSRT